MSSDGTNDHAHAANGSVGTIDFETGTINGESNGHTNGHSNGYSNIEANGHSNGHANGHSNGYSNIEANGHSNGHANGGDAQVDAANGATNDHSVAPEAGRYTKIPGPLGIESASLKGKVALVTGAGTFFLFHESGLNADSNIGRGIGREMALELGRRGAKVVVNYANSDEAAMEAVAEIKRCGSEAIAVKANVSVVKDIISLFAQAKAHFGELNIVCSNSGVVSFGHIGEVTEEEYDRVMGINTRGQFFVAREAYRHLSIGGRLIMMGSITGQAKGVPKHTRQFYHPLQY
jgi:tetrahydroxynaphthalene reductase